MSDTPTRRVAEKIPSLEGDTSGIASAMAPFIFADEFSVHGFYNDIVHITAEAIRFMPSGDGRPIHDRVVVAHLRMNRKALAGLKASIALIEGMIADPTKNRVTLE